MERLENRQYLVKADGSGRVLLRTRTHLRKINAATRDRSAYDVEYPQDQTEDPGTDKRPLLIPGTLGNGARVIEPTDTGVEPTGLDDSMGAPLNTPEDSTSLPDAPTPPPQEEVRRSTRLRNAPKRLHPVMSGKRHGEI